MHVCRVYVHVCVCVRVVFLCVWFVHACGTASLARMRLCVVWVYVLETCVKARNL
jgi:hypothetical protein